MKSQMKKADKSGAEMAFILGDDELEKNTITVKFLREKKDQKVIELDGITDFLKNNN
ncbi:MAG: His/Gly/Thr/Pro-type tRNA ligase C-terminal domain-containing protein [Gammaproteobacteria bacterium]|nr:His/Gly/Thr/Pro-type tRNA ligase C-terminal domain-containing protein [Gammaproteobacteria bacterium]